MLAQLLDMSRQPEEAEAAYRAWLRLDPRSAAANNNLAYLMAERGRNLDEAVNLASRAVSLSPQDRTYKDTLGYVYLRNGHVGEALHIFEQLAQRHPADRAIQQHYALAVGAAGKSLSVRN